MTATRLRQIPSAWQQLVGPVRRGSSAEKLLTILPARPILSSGDASAVIDAPRSSVFDAITRLHNAGILRPLTARKRNQVWGAGAILDELDDLGLRIAQASR